MLLLSHDKFCDAWPHELHRQVCGQQAKQEKAPQNQTSDEFAPALNVVYLFISVSSWSKSQSQNWRTLVPRDPVHVFLDVQAGDIFSRTRVSGPIRGEYGGQLTNHRSPGPGFPAPPPRHGLGDDEGSEGLEPVLQTILDSVVLTVWAECVLGPLSSDLLHQTFKKRTYLSQPSGLRNHLPMTLFRNTLYGFITYYCLYKWQCTDNVDLPDIFSNNYTIRSCIISPSTVSRLKWLVQCWSCAVSVHKLAILETDHNHGVWTWFIVPVKLVNSFILTHGRRQQRSRAGIFLATVLPICYCRS